MTILALLVLPRPWLELERMVWARINPCRRLERIMKMTATDITTLTHKVRHKVTEITTKDMRDMANRAMRDTRMRTNIITHTMDRVGPHQVHPLTVVQGVHTIMAAVRVISTVSRLQCRHVLQEPLVLEADISLHRHLSLEPGRLLL